MNKYFYSGMFAASLLFAQNVQPKDSFQKAPQMQQTLQAHSTQGKRTIKEATMGAINLVRSHSQICAKATTPLQWNPRLYELAKEHSIDMAVTGKLQHNGSGTKTDTTALNLQLHRGSFFYERVNQKAASKAILSGELLIRTDLNSLQSPRTLIDYWIKRADDCKIIMDPRFSDVAIAKVISNKDHRAYWTLLLSGARK